MDAVTLTDIAAENIRRLLALQGKTQAKLAELSGMTVPDVSRLLRGGRATSLGTLAKVATALDTTVADLLSQKQTDAAPAAEPAPTTAPPTKKSKK
jgi:transcriptional regulator with XRE-family HTH domain